MGAADRNRDAADTCRRRVSLAIAEIAHAGKLRSATAADICRRAELSQDEFASLFPSEGAALDAAFAEAFGELLEPAREAVAAAPDWLRGVADGLGALLETAAAKPRLTELCLVHWALASDEASGHDYGAALEALVAMLRPVRSHAEREGRQRRTAPEVAEQFLAHGILFQLIQIGMQEEPAVDRDRRPELLMLVLMTFYDTGDAARMCAEVEAEGLSEGGPGPVR